MRYLTILATLLYIISIGIPASGQTQQKLTATDSAEDDRFGESVAVYGDIALVGARLNDDNGGASGSAYVFTKAAGVWTENQKLTASDAAAGDVFGSSVAVFGDYALIGAEGDGDIAISAGSAYIFKRIGGVWIEQQELKASDGESFDSFGLAVAIHGDVAVIASLDDDGGSLSGSAHVFRNLGGVWTKEQKLTASDAAAGDHFGESVAIFGDVILVGAYQDDDNGDDSGSVYIFRRIGGVWTEDPKLTASDAAAGDQFGVSASIFSDVALIGAQHDGDGGSSGSAYIFRNVGGVWTEEQKLTASDGQSFDQFGVSVSIFGDVALVGAHQNDINASNSGSVYIFRNIGGVWTEEEIVTASDAQSFDQFGQTLAISGENALIGAYHDDDSGTSSGAAYAMEIDNSVGVSTASQDLLVGFELGEAFPNPFRLETTIRFEVSHSLQAKLVVYDILGREVATLVDRVVSAGRHSTTFEARSLPSGAYFYRLETPQHTLTKTVLLLD